jgi:hypothetical protein
MEGKGRWQKAFGSFRELRYQLGLSNRLNFFSPQPSAISLLPSCRLSRNRDQQILPDHR